MTIYRTSVGSFPNVAITGKFRSGKNAIADYLTEKYGYTQFAFGDALKDDFHRRYPEIAREPKPRIGYQNHGQLMRALIGEDVWIDACFGRVDALEAEEMYTDDPPLRAVITDLRQPSEYDRCRAEGYVIIRVNCPDNVRLARAKAAGDTFTLAELNHETELHVNSFAVEYDVDNSGSLAELYAQMDAIMTEVSTW